MLALGLLIDLYLLSQCRVGKIRFCPRGLCRDENFRLTPRVQQVAHPTLLHKADATQVIRISHKVIARPEKPRQSSKNYQFCTFY